MAERPLIGKVLAGLGVDVKHHFDLRDRYRHRLDTVDMGTEHTLAVAKQVIAPLATQYTRALDSRHLERNKRTLGISIGLVVIDMATLLALALPFGWTGRAITHPSSTFVGERLARREQKRQHPTPGFHKFGGRR